MIDSSLDTDLKAIICRKIFVNKQFVILFVFLSFLQGCGLRKSVSIKYSDFPEAGQNDSSCDTQERSSSLLGAKEDLDEDIGSFEFDCAESPFIVNALSHAKDELVLEHLSETASSRLGERYSDSLKYGLQIIYFDFDGKKIKADQVEKIEKNLDIVKKMVLKGYDVVVEGHSCDSAGSPEYNLILSEDRSKAVLDYLIDNRVEKDSVTNLGRGCEMKIVPFGNREQQSPNRRVEIFLYLKR